MLSPSEFIDQVFLAHEYDPRKAHEYYLRTRELKGRTSGQTSPTSLVRKSSLITTAPKTTTSKTAEQRRKETEAQIESLKTRLETLRKVLAELVKQAQARSGQDTSDSKKSEKKQTAEEKKKAAKASKDYYEKHKNDNPTPSEQLKDLQTKIKAVEAKIKEMREKLKMSKKTAVKKPDSVGVRTKKR